MNILTNEKLVPEAYWCWFQDPRAVCHNNITYIASVNAHGDLVVSSYASATNKRESVIIDSDFQKDDHACPTLQIMPDGKITVWYSSHRGAKIWYRTTTVAGDISNWGTTKSVTVNYPNSTYTDYTYPSPVYLSAENKTYLFWRGGNGSATLSTTADMSTWSPGRRYFHSGTRPYVKVVGNGVDTIHFFITDSHPTDNTYNNLYHFYYKSGNWYKTDGTLIKSTAQMIVNSITPAQCTKVYNSQSSGRLAWNWDIALGENGFPVVTFATFVSPTDHRYHCGRWDGTQWNVTELTAGGDTISEDGIEKYYSGGIVLDHTNPNIVYLSKQTSSTSWEIERWISRPRKRQLGKRINYTWLNRKECTAPST